MRKQKIRQHNKHAAKYAVQAKRTEANKLARAERNAKRIKRAVQAEPKAPVQRLEESLVQRDERHQLHQAMLHDHIARKASAKETHNKRLHRYKIIPLQLV
jgi:hypothetical protein